MSQFRKHTIDYAEEELPVPVESEPSAPSIPVPISKEENESSPAVVDIDQKCPKCKVRTLKFHERKDGARCPVCTN